MSNFSYCRYENTAADMQDCLDAIRNDGLNVLSGSERKCAHKLYETAMKYIKEYEKRSGITIMPVESVHGVISYFTCDESVELYNNGMLCWRGSKKSAESIWQDLTGVTLKGEDYEEYMALQKSYGLQSGTISMVNKESGETIKTATIA